MSTPLKIFIIYAREDKSYKDDLLKSLKLLQTQGLIEPWHDGDIKPGDEWDKEIKARLRAAEIILPIISFDFFDSDYIHRVEIVEAFERYDRGEALIIPIIADFCPWTDYPRLKDFQALPAEGKPIDDWSDRKRAMSSIYDGVKRIIVEREGQIRLKKEKNREEAKRFSNMAYNSNDFHERIRHYSKAIELDPDSADAFFSRGNAKIELGQHADAIKDFDQAIQLNPEAADAYYNRGSAKCHLGQDTEGIKDFDQAIRLNPDYVNAYNNRGVAKCKLGLYTEGIKDCNQAIRLNPDYVNAYVVRGLAKKNLGLLEEAKKDYQKALSIDPNYEPAKNNLKNLEEQMKQKP